MFEVHPLVLPFQELEDVFREGMHLEGVVWSSIDTEIDKASQEAYIWPWFRDALDAVRRAHLAVDPRILGYETGTTEQDGEGP